MKVLQITVHFSPNIGGVETHLWDLVTYLSNKNWSVAVLCYQPLSTISKWKIIEHHKNLKIFRIPWITGFFYKFISYPVLEFVYLFPGLFISTPVFLLVQNPDVIHAHGLIAGFAAVFWRKIFRKRIIISSHSMYSFPKKGIYKQFAYFVFSNADKVLCLSKKSCLEMKNLGLNNNKIEQFTYWINLEKFKKIANAREKFLWKEKFIILFVGRLVSEKGIDVLLDSVKKWNKNIGLMFVGVGPLEQKIIQYSTKYKQIHFVGKMTQDQLPTLYSASDVTIVPSVSEEGFGRVIMESLACGTPIIGSNRGSIAEAMDQSVGEIIEVSSENIKKTVEYFFKNSDELKSLSENAVKFAKRRYSDKNAEVITESYTN